MKKIFIHITLIAALSFFSSCFADSKNPVDVADIVARDLAISGYGALGHVGLWTGDKVIEVLDASPAVVQNTLDNFKGRTTYWGAAYFTGWDQLPNIALPSQIHTPYTYIATTAKMAVIKRALQIQAIGASYTLSPKITASTVQVCSDSGNCTGPTRGKYRCDTFIKDAYLTAGIVGVDFDGMHTPADLWNSFSKRD